MGKTIFYAGAAFALLLMQPAFGAEEFGSDDSDINPASRRENVSDHGPISSTDAMQMGEVNTQVLTAAGERNEKAGNYDNAITFYRKALDIDPDDIDVHVHYAQVLEKKLKKSDDSDPSLFNKVVREWLLVMRNEVGEEKGLSFKGVAAPALGTWYRDEEHNMLAKQHIVKLVGRAPKYWETNTMFLKKVLKPTESSVAGRVVKPSDKELNLKAQDYDDDKIKSNKKELSAREHDLTMDK
jgi:tetratricopeptide (TPR) repeat protein